MAYLVSTLKKLDGRNKHFVPAFLGETFEIFDEKNKMKFLAE